MKKIAILCLLALSLHAQKAVDLGVLKGGDYQVHIPANWNKKLIMYAHGYQFMGTPPASANAQLAQRLKPFLDRGFSRLNLRGPCHWQCLQTRREVL